MLGLFELFEALGVRCAYKVRLHVEDAALRVHQVLLLLTLNMDHAHHNAIDHVDGLPIIFECLVVFSLHIFEGVTLLLLLLLAQEKRVGNWAFLVLVILCILG